MHESCSLSYACKLPKSLQQNAAVGGHVLIIACDTQSEMDFLPEILLSVSPSRLQLLQKGVRRVWHRFMYKAFPLFQREMLSLGAVDQQPDFGQYASQIDPRLLAQVGEDDAFATIMQWLYERMSQEKKI